MIRLMTLIVACVPATTWAQTYDLSWHTIDGGGGNCTGAKFAVVGTIGQPDAYSATVMIGGSYQLMGGFWPGAAETCVLAGDMNHDGLVDGADIQAYINCLLMGSGSCDCADMNGGGVNDQDVTAFVAVLLER